MNTYTDKQSTYAMTSPATATSATTHTPTITIRVEHFEQFKAKVVKEDKDYPGVFAPHTQSQPVVVLSVKGELSIMNEWDCPSQDHCEVCTVEDLLSNIYQMERAYMWDESNSAYILHNIVWESDCEVKLALKRSEMATASV